METIISVKDLTKSYFSKTIETNVLKSVSLDIYKNEFLSIVGKSGSGKSTLLYQMGLLDYPTSGDIEILNCKTSDLSEIERTKFRLDNFGFIFQNYSLLPELNAVENVMLPNIMRGTDKASARKMSEIALGNVGLGDKFHRYISELSGGENQRVAIARAISNKPQIIFADEVTANLDEETSEGIMDLFGSINKNGHTLVLITHELDYAEKSDRILQLHNHQLSIMDNNRTDNQRKTPK